MIAPLLLAVALAAPPPGEPAFEVRPLGVVPEAVRVPDGVVRVEAAPDGALWLARCRAGLTRLDPIRGTRRTFTTRDGLPDGCIHDLAVDADSGAWVLTADRATRVGPEGDVSSPALLDPEGDAAVMSVTIDGDESLWLAGQGGRLRGLPRGDAPLGESATERRYSGENLGALGTITAARAGPDGVLWLSSRDRLTRLDPRDGRFTVWTSRGREPDLPSGQPGAVTFARDGAWVLVLPDPLSGATGALVALRDDGPAPLSLPALPRDPLRLEATDDGALWIADAEGIVRVSPDRSQAQRVAVRRGFVAGGPWLVPASADSVWAATEGVAGATVLHRIGPGGEQLDRIGPQPEPQGGRLVAADAGVRLAQGETLWRLTVDGALARPEPGVAEALRGRRAERLLHLATGPSGRLWLSGQDGLRIASPGGTFEDVPPFGDDPTVRATLELPDGSAMIAAAAGLFVRDAAGRVLRVVDELDRPIDGVDALTLAPDGEVWAWGATGAFTVRGSDGRRELSGPIRDLLFDGAALWWARPDGIRRRTDGRVERVPMPRRATAPLQIAVRAGELQWVWTREGLWRRATESWVRVPGSAEGELLRGDDGAVWRWDPDGLHVLPADEATWRWIGLRREPSAPESTASPIAADAIRVVALDGALAVAVEGRVVGDAAQPDPIVDLDVRGDRWAALSARGVLLRGQGYRLIERTFAPGPARRVAVAPRGACVAGAAVWCRDEAGWRQVVSPTDLPAPLPAVALDVDDEGRAVSLHPGALCRQGEGCRGLPGLGQTALSARGELVFGTTQGLYSLNEAGRPALLRAGAVRDLARGPGALWIATDGGGLVAWRTAPDGSRSEHTVEDPALSAADELAAARTGRVIVRVGSTLFEVEPR